MCTDRKPLHNYYKVFGFHSWETFFKGRRTGNFKEAYFNVPGPECDMFPKRCVDWRNHLNKADAGKLRWKWIFISCYIDQELGLSLIIFTTEFWGIMSEVHGNTFGRWFGVFLLIIKAFELLLALKTRHTQTFIIARLKVFFVLDVVLKIAI